MSFWDERFSGEDYLYGREPNAFLAREAWRLPPGGRVLALADGEGRNGVFLAARGHRVHAVDGSAVAQAKARRLAADRGVALDFELADLAAWTFPDGAYDGVAAIFFQFAGPDVRRRLFEGVTRCLKPGGVLLLLGYRPEQIAYGTGGPSAVENLYTEALLRDAFASLEILHLAATEEVIAEGAGHRGRSALVELVARRPPA